MQLAVVNALTASVLPPPILERMRGWLTGVDVPDGLAVDTDLRWRLLHALIAHAAATEDDIGAELERDNPDSGRRNAEQARALIPTPAAKQRAWQRAVHDDDLPRAITVAIVNGFNHPAQRSLLAPYVEKYFAEIADLWARRTSEQAQPVVAGLFPSWAIDKTAVDAADAWLADRSHPCSAPQWKPLCRLVAEGRADLVRALTAREFDRI
jgi:aminopeptidase N